MAETHVAEGKVTFELVSPEKLLASRAVDMVVVPGADGLFGVLPGHSPVIAQLQPGVINVYDGANIADRIFVGGGFVEVTPERCVVLAETALPVAELDRAKIEARLGELHQVEDVAIQAGDASEGGIISQLALYEAMLAAIDAQGGGHHGKH